VRPWLAERLQSAVEQQHNIIVRPRGARAELIQLDDLGTAMVGRVYDAAFLILTTSPGNYQAWVAVGDRRADLARRLRQGSGADPSASGAVRIAGSLNFKRCYQPTFPQVSILHSAPQRIVTPGELEAKNLVVRSSQRPIPPARVSSFLSTNTGPTAWPSYARCLQNAPLAHRSDRPDVSRADFVFCMIAIDWGWSVTATCARLQQISSKARENGDTYVRLTVERAAAAVNRRDRKNFQA
jgi:hypothetical protein